MRLPMQAVPVQRAIVGFSTVGSASRESALSGLYSTGNGLVASAEADVGPNGWLDDLLNKYPPTFPTLPKPFELPTIIA